MVGENGNDGSVVEDLVGQLDDQEVRRLLAAAAEVHEDVLQSVRLAAAGDDERLRVLRAEVDRGLRTRRHLDYWGSTAWAREASPVVDALEEAVAANPSTNLVKLLERAAGHLVKVIMRADDSNGLIGDLAGRVLELHRRACATGVADPVPLARWMVRFTFEDQDFFQLDPVSYADALGDEGLAVYRQAVAERSVPAEVVPLGRDLWAPFPSFAAKYVAERLAVLDGDADRLVVLLGGDLSSPHQFTRVAEAMVELGRNDDALAWARRGIAETSGWQVAKLYDLVARLLSDSGDTGAVLELRRDHHQRSPSASTYGAFQAAARAAAVWDRERESARAVLAARDAAGLVDVLLSDGDADEAWTAATAADRALNSPQWLRLAEAREPTDAAGATRVYLRLVDEVLVNADRGAYRQAVRYLKAARRAATAAGLRSDFEETLAALRERHRRRPTLIAMLDKANLR